MGYPMGAMAGYGGMGMGMYGMGMGGMGMGGYGGMPASSGAMGYGGSYSGRGGYSAGSGGSYGSAGENEPCVLVHLIHPLLPRQIRAPCARTETDQMFCCPDKHLLVLAHVKCHSKADLIW